MMLATPVIQMPTITAVKAVSFSNPNQHPFLRPHLGGFCLRKPKIPSTTRTTLFCCKSQLQDFAPLTSAAYGTLLSPAVSLPVLMLHSAFSLSFHINSPVINIISHFSNWFQLLNLGVKGRSLEASLELLLWHLYFTVRMQYLCALFVSIVQAYYLMQSTETKAIGDALGFGAAFLFSCVFGIRLAATRKPIPAGPLLGLSICALVVFTSAYLQDRL
ncbi:hypothetical protein CXB51_007780 [Gossypium anomalum]|uniref:Uncharacterized protein n=1 Tax=Gossypium anomalum TaxID=47600 RepID=A0A8J5Z8G7_9ROSI|nr:hypothetical protein CXB51_007780 [Gossypium anomalum]